MHDWWIDLSFRWFGVTFYDVHEMRIEQSRRCPGVHMTCEYDKAYAQHGNNRFYYILKKVI